MPECMTNQFTSSQSERTRFEVDPTLSQCVRIATGEPVLPFLYIRKAGLSSIGQYGGGVHRSSRGGNVPPGSMGKPCTGRRGTGSVFQVVMSNGGVRPT